MRIALTPIAAAAALAALAGCGGEEPPTTPPACLAPAAAYLRSLESAPAPVRLRGETPISDCLVAEQAAGPLQAVGGSLVEAAGELNREIRHDPDPETIARLGYLVGAVQEGASATAGIHTDLVRRLDSAARYPGPGGRPFGAGFERAFAAGYAAGQADG